MSTKPELYPGFIGAQLNLFYATRSFSSIKNVTGRFNVRTQYSSDTYETRMTTLVFERNTSFNASLSIESEEAYGHKRPISGSDKCIYYNLNENLSNNNPLLYYVIHNRDVHLLLIIRFEQSETSIHENLTLNKETKDSIIVEISKDKINIK